MLYAALIIDEILPALLRLISMDLDREEISTRLGAIHRERMQLGLNTYMYMAGCDISQLVVEFVQLVV